MGTMTRGELLDRLRQEGVIVTRRQLEEAINNQRLPRPRKNGAGHYEYDDGHLRRLTEIFKEPGVRFR